MPAVKINPADNDLANVWNDRSVSACDRAQMVIYNITEKGLDYTPHVTEIIQNSDEMAKTKEAIDSLGSEPLVSERYVGEAGISGVGKLGVAIHGNYAWVTSKDSVSCLPCDIKDELRIGDLVLIAPKVGAIVGKDGTLATTGQVATVECVKDGKIVVKTMADQLAVAWLHHSLIDNPPEVGEKVIYDERHKFVIDRINTDTKGDDLLANNLPTVRRSQVGAPHPVADQIINHFRDAIERPEWLEKLGSRDRKSYLFVGQTGGGKSYHIKLIATEVHDLIEEVTGNRTSRVLICDASQFWSPYFGETEQRINNWAKKVSALGSQKLRTKDGTTISIPILGVIEECEALFRSRGGDQHASGHLFDRVLSLLLQKLESVENAIGVPVVWVCSTNRPDLIDAAALRRIGMRKAIFGNLNAEATKQVMQVKVDSLNVNKDQFVDLVVSYLHEYEDGQELVVITFASGKKHVLRRSELVTPSLLEEAVSYSVDQCLARSREAGRLQKVSAQDTVEFLDSHFRHISGIINPHNVAEYCPERFSDERIANVCVAR